MAKLPPYVFRRPNGSYRYKRNVPKKLRPLIGKTITDKRLSTHSLRHRMKDKLRNSDCPEDVSLAILGHSSNTIAAIYGSGFALDKLREHMSRVWET